MDGLTKIRRESEKIFFFFSYRRHAENRKKRKEGKKRGKKNPYISTPHTTLSAQMRGWVDVLETRGKGGKKEKKKIETFLFI